jgi:hypothetical protein
VEAYWDNGLSKQRIVANLVRKDLLAPHLESLIKLLGCGKQPNASSLSGAEPIEPPHAACWGPMLVARSLWREFGLENILDALAPKTLGVQKSGALPLADRVLVLVANRLCQEAILGIGGVRMLDALGFKQIRCYHMNEGHASLLTLELLDDESAKAGRKSIIHDDVNPVRRMCVFTTHTPVPAGHDQFPMELVVQVLGRRKIYDMKEVFCCEGVLNMTFLAANLSHYINGVAKRHGEISRHMFSRYVIDAITNGVHAGTWTPEPFRKLFDR